MSPTNVVRLLSVVFKRDTEPYLRASSKGNPKRRPSTDVLHRSSSLGSRMTKVDPGRSVGTLIFRCQSRESHQTQRCGTGVSKRASESIYRVVRNSEVGSQLQKKNKRDSEPSGHIIQSRRVSFHAYD